MGPAIALSAALASLHPPIAGTQKYTAKASEWHRSCGTPALRTKPHDAPRLSSEAARMSNAGDRRLARLGPRFRFVEEYVVV